MNTDGPPLVDGRIAPPPELLDWLERHDEFVVIGHKEPDGDCLGSQLALASLLRRRGKRTHLISPGPFSRPEIVELEPLFGNEFPEEARGERTGVILVDCSTPDRIGPLYRAVEDFPLCVIDHHASGSPFGDPRWIAPKAPSVTFMIARLITALGDQPTPEEARQLFFGLATDTGFFRHLDRTGADSLATAADLVRSGSSPKEAFRRMYGNRPAESRRLLARLLERMRSLSDGRLLYTWETLDDKRELGESARDSDILYQLLLGTRDCEAAAVIREEEPGLCSAGLRSLHDLDVGTIARDFGGGGHAKAAGFSFTGSRAELEGRLLPLLESRLSSI